MSNDRITDTMSDSDGPLIDDNVIRIQLRKPQHRKWELRTRNRSPGIRFPTIQLFDCNGNLLVETNNDNIDIKSCDVDAHIRSGQSLNESDYRENIKRQLIRKNNTVSGERELYTRFFKNNNGDNVMKMCIKSNCIKPDTNLCIISNGKKYPNISETNDSLLNVNDYFSERRNSDESTIMSTLGVSENDKSSYKSSDDESSATDSNYTYVTGKAGTLMLSKEPLPETSRRRPGIEHDLKGHYVENWIDKNAQSNCDIISWRRGLLKHCGEEVPNIKCSLSKKEHGLQKSKSFSKQNNRFSRDKIPRRSYTDVLVRPDRNVTYASPHRKVSFLDTYLKSLPTRIKPEIDWRSQANEMSNESCGRVKLRDRPREPANKTWRHCHFWEDKSDGVPRNATFNSEADAEFKKRLLFYRRGNSSSDYWYWKRVQNVPRTRRRSEGDGAIRSGSSCSESVDEADKVLDRLRRRIIQNKLREKHVKNCACCQGFIPCKPRPRGSFESHPLSRGPNDAPLSMGSNVSQHSGKGLTGRRARSSGDLCNGESKNATETSVYGSVIGDSMGWNRSLPNHLDANRPERPGEASNNNYGEVGSYRARGRCGRNKGNAYRICRAGSELEPVWKLQDPACDQGYGSERSPEEDLPPPAALGQPGPLGAMRPRASLDYETQLRAMYPFIDSENSFEVVVEKDGRGLGMSVGAAGGAAAGLVRIRRLYPPQPAWSTGQLQPGDLLLAANQQPLAGLSSHEALDVLRTTPSTVRLLVCRPSADVLERLTPPGEPPAPPARFPPPDPLNCHPLHTRLSHTASNTTTSSSEGGGPAAGPGRPGSKLAYSNLQSDGEDARAGSSSPVSGRNQPTRRSGLRLPFLPSPLPMPILDVQYGEFDIVMNKVNGSLGFTLRKEDHSVLGHYVRALVREPALSDTRIHPGDRIVAVNDIPMSNLSHPEAVAFLRQCGEEVKLRLYRDHAATPLSAISPTECDSSLRPKPHLRQEAVNMLCDLAARRLSPDIEAGVPRAPCLSPRKLRKLTRDSTGFSQGSTGSQHQPYTVNCPTSTETYSNSDDELSHAQSYHSNDTVAQRPRPDYLALSVDATHSIQDNGTAHRSHLTAAHGYELNNLDKDVLDAPHVYRDSLHLQTEGAGELSGEPMSMPAELTCASAGEDLHQFRRSPAYQSAAVHTTSDEGHKDTGIGLKKWKGVQLSPESSRHAKLQKENRAPAAAPAMNDTQPTIVSVELNRGWNSRLGFSVQSHADTNQSYISAIYGDSVAAKDGRLQQGDIILQVNDENVTEMKTNEVIDLLRILRGAICITVLRPPRHTA